MNVCVCLFVQAWHPNVCPSNQPSLKWHTNLEMTLRLRCSLPCNSRRFLLRLLCLSFFSLLFVGLLLCFFLFFILDYIFNMPECKCFYCIVVKVEKDISMVSNDWMPSNVRLIADCFPLVIFISSFAFLPSSFPHSFLFFRFFSINISFRTFDFLT